MFDYLRADSFRLTICITGALALLLLLVSSPGFATDYAGQQTRAIKSLSENDIDDLTQGRGWGLAKPAELNGLPGPIHLLELKDQLALDAQQQSAIEAIYAEMNQQARELGLRYIEQERALETLLITPGITNQSLSEALQRSAQTLADLRLVHLAAHLKTPDILDPSQLEQYNVLRGYAEMNPCDAVPKGHDPDMWKRHNNCE